MRILITGGAGFIASHVAEAYLRAGHRVTIVDNLSTGKRANIPKRAQFENADIRSPRLLRIFHRFKPELLNHHAAQMDVRKSVADPEWDANINIMGTLNLLKCCKMNGVRKVIFSSSGGVIYGECGPRPPDEESPARPASPYGISKLAGEKYIQNWGETSGGSALIFRYGNVYGPRQDPFGEAGVVAIFIRKMLFRKPVFIFGDGRQIRDFVFVEDVARVNLLALRAGGRGVLNIGTGTSASINEIFRSLARLTHYPLAPRRKPQRAGELFRSRLAVKKAKRLLGWRASVSIHEGLEKTVNYFR